MLCIRREDHRCSVECLCEDMGEAEHVMVLLTFQEIGPLKGGSLHPHNCRHYRFAKIVCLWIDSGRVVSGHSEQRHIGVERIQANSTEDPANEGFGLLSRANLS